MYDEFFSFVFLKRGTTARGIIICLCSSYHGAKVPALQFMLELLAGPGETEQCRAFSKCIMTFRAVQNHISLSITTQISCQDFSYFVEICSIFNMAIDK